MGGVIDGSGSLGANRNDVWTSGERGVLDTGHGRRRLVAPILSHTSAVYLNRLWVLGGCVVALVVVGLTAPVRQHRTVILAVAGGAALYAVSLGILELAERVSSASVETDFERGHTAVSAVWALVGLGLLVVGLLRSSAALRYGGLALFGLSLAKIFVYDLAELSSVARAFSFIVVGALLLAGGFFLQRLSGRLGPRDASG